MIIVLVYCEKINFVEEFILHVFPAFSFSLLQVKPEGKKVLIYILTSKNPAKTDGHIKNLYFYKRLHLPLKLRYFLLY